MPAPFAGQSFTFYNPDGTEVGLLGWGNQFQADFETPDGYAVIRDPATGFYVYASVSVDGSTLVPTGARVGASDPGALGLAPHLRPTSPPDGRRDALDGGVQQPSRWEERRREKAAAGTDSAARAAFAPAPSGEVVGLCVLVDFPDVRGSITRQQVDDFCNLPGYSEFGNNGSVFDYFRDVSGGKMRYRNIVVDYHTAKHNRSHYTDESVAYPKRARELALEVLTQLKNAGFDFDRLTTDGLYVYALNIFYAGERVNSFKHGLWPHQSHLAIPFDISHTPPPLPGIPPTTPNRLIFDYQITNIGSELTLRTFCHENGHMVCDFPDLYDSDDPAQSTGVGNYCLMAYGGIGADKDPVAVSGYLKYEAGWVSRVRDLNNGDVATLEAASNDFLVHRKNGDEYFLLENRLGFIGGRDSKLPGSGVLIWHVDRRGSNNNEQMLPDKHYELSLEQADGLFQMERSASNYGDSNDPFGPQRGEFGEFTVPDSKWWDGTRSALDIVQVSAPAQSMTITTKGVQGLVVAAYGADAAAGGWRVDRHPRMLAKLAGHGGRSVVDIVGFGDDGVWTAMNNGDGTFAAQSRLVVADYGYNGGWRVEDHVRVAADLTGDGVADLVGFGNDGVWTHLNDGNGNFGAVQLAVADFGFNGGWRNQKHVRLAADLTGDGAADLIGFGNDAVWVYLNDGRGNFGGIRQAVADFAYNGGWRLEKHLRFVADIAGNGRGDLVGFGNDAVWFYPNDGNGNFGGIRQAIANFNYNGGWRVGKHPRFLASMATHADGRRYADIVGFHDAGVYIAFNNGDGTFRDPVPAVAGFGTLGGWRVDQHPRFVADLTGDGTGDIVGFADDGVWVAINNGDGSFQAPKLVIDGFGAAAGGWRVERHPRLVADLNGDGKADVLGFGNAGVWESLNLGDGTGGF